MYQNVKKDEDDLINKAKSSYKESLLKCTDRSCQTSIKSMETKETPKDLICKSKLNRKKETYQVDFCSTDSSSDQKNNNNNKKITLMTNSIIDNDFFKKMEKEDESLEEFKEIFLKKQNIIVNWDYVWDANV